MWEMAALLFLFLATVGIDGIVVKLPTCLHGHTQHAWQVFFGGDMPDQHAAHKTQACRGHLR